MENVENIKIVLEKTKPKKRIFVNALMAFITGGVICLDGQIILEIFINYFKIDEKTSFTLMYITIILIASIITALGFFDKLGQIAGAGSYLPITGFANSMTSAAIESKSEGLIFGILSNMLKLAGTVIVAGVVSSFIVSSLLYLVMR